MEVLETGQRPANIPDELFNSYKEARSIIDRLSERLREAGVPVRALPATAAPGRPSRQALMQAIRENVEVGGYLRQRYALLMRIRHMTSCRVQHESVRSLI